MNAAHKEADSPKPVHPRAAVGIERMEQRRDALYRELRLAALEDRMCPTNLQLMQASGYQRRDSISVSLRAMRDAGDVTIHVDRAIRVATFPDGKTTASYETFARIRDEVAVAFGVEPYRLVTRGKKAPVIRARFAAIAVLMRRYPKISLQIVGRVMGDRDHSTILYATERVKQITERDAEFRETVDQLAAGKRVVCSPPVRPSRKRKPRPDNDAAPPPRAFSWCEQCESRVAPERALRCASRWCSLKATA